MSDSFSANVTEDQLIKLLRDGFGNGLAKNLADQIVAEFKVYAETQMLEAENSIRQQVKTVVSKYVAKSTSIYNDPVNMQTVININITKVGD